MIRLTYFKGLILFLLASPTWGQDLSPLRFNEAWKHKIFTLAPEEPRFPSQEKQRLLVFSLHTGFEHWVIPHTEEMISLVAEKSGAFEVVRSKDIAWFEPDSLAQFDALILNNTCSKPDHRHLFWDQLTAQFPLEDSIHVMQKALRYEEHLLNYVKEGGGLLLIHGAVTTLNNSSRFSAMVGASFDYHPPQQLVHVQLVDPSHPLVAAFPKEGWSHIDEPYFYKNAYQNLDFKPLMYFENSQIRDQRKGQELKEGKTYVSWIRAEGKGKVMYISPSHNAHSFENPALLQFFLDGMQYVVGDVSCDETPLGKQ
jgi:uncharacterized protein